MNKFRDIIITKKLGQHFIKELGISTVLEEKKIKNIFNKIIKILAIFSAVIIN